MGVGSRIYRGGLAATDRMGKEWVRWRCWVKRLRWFLKWLEKVKNNVLVICKFAVNIKVDVCKSELSEMHYRSFSCFLISTLSSFSTFLIWIALMNAVLYFMILIMPRDIKDFFVFHDLTNLVESKLCDALLSYQIHILIGWASLQINWTLD